MAARGRRHCRCFVAPVADIAYALVLTVAWGLFLGVELFKVAVEFVLMPAPELRVAMVKPVFCVVLTDGPQWSVEAEWPDGTIEHVDTFKGHSDAVKWVSTRSETWLRERASRPR